MAASMGLALFMTSPNPGKQATAVIMTRFSLKHSHLREIFQLATLPYLDPIIPLDSHLLPNPIVFLEYIPAIQNMVRIDDELEKADAEDLATGRQRKNRKTGRAMRITSLMAANPSYVRQMAGDLETPALQAVRDTRFKPFIAFSDDADEVIDLRSSGTALFSP